MNGPTAIPLEVGVPWLVRVIEAEVDGVAITLRFTMPIATRPPTDVLRSFAARYTMALVNGAHGPASTARSMRKRTRELAE